MSETVTSGSSIPSCSYGWSFASISSPEDVRILTFVPGTTTNNSGLDFQLKGRNVFDMIIDASTSNFKQYLRYHAPPIVPFKSGTKNGTLLFIRLSQKLAFIAWDFGSPIAGIATADDQSLQAQLDANKIEYFMQNSSSLRVTSAVEENPDNGRIFLMLTDLSDNSKTIGSPFFTWPHLSQKYIAELLESHTKSLADSVIKSQKVTPNFALFATRDTATIHCGKIAFVMIDNTLPDLASPSTVNEKLSPIQQTTKSSFSSFTMQSPHSSQQMSPLVSAFDMLIEVAVKEGGNRNGDDPKRMSMVKTPDNQNSGYAPFPLSVDSFHNPPPVATLKPLTPDAVPKRKNSKNQKNLICEHCSTTQSPEWRRGPSGSKSLCNACGLRYARRLAKEQKMKQKAESQQSSADSSLNSSMESLNGLNGPQMMMMPSNAQQHQHQMQRMSAAHMQMEMYHRRNSPPKTFLPGTSQEEAIRRLSQGYRYSPYSSSGSSMEGDNFSRQNSVTYPPQGPGPMDMSGAPPLFNSNIPNAYGPPPPNVYNHMAQQQQQIQQQQMQMQQQMQQQQHMQSLQMTPRKSSTPANFGSNSNTSSPFLIEHLRKTSFSNDRRQPYHYSNYPSHSMETNMTNGGLPPNPLPGFNSPMKQVGHDPFGLAAPTTPQLSHQTPAPVNTGMSLPRPGSLERLHLPEGSGMASAKSSLNSLLNNDDAPADTGMSSDTNGVPYPAPVLVTSPPLHPSTSGQAR